MNNATSQPYVYLFRGPFHLLSLFTSKCVQDCISFRQVPVRVGSVIGSVIGSFKKQFCPGSFYHFCKKKMKDHLPILCNLPSSHFCIFANGTNTGSCIYLLLTGQFPRKNMPISQDSLSCGGDPPNPILHRVSLRTYTQLDNFI